ncbi:MAG TPA: DUF2877 domain-containing protein [Burkholderiales bacterium]|nr:DUF2877 domain-containing protein [Burkholderiales bacterium]
MIEAEWIGSRVPSSFQGHVHSVFRHACNIEADDGALVTLLSGELGNIPHGVLCSATEPMDFQNLCAVGQGAELAAAELRIPRAGVAFDLSNAAVWRCEVSACAIDLSDDRTADILSDLRTILSERGAAGGFARLVPGNDEPASPLDRAIRRRLERALPVLAGAIGRFDADRTVEALAPLIGLGPGLTPAGDDFIVGLLAALWSRHDCRALLAKLHGPLARLGATSHPISRQFLMDALEGEFSETLSDLAVAIRMRDRECAATAAQRVMRIGHTSGADALTGFLFGLQPALVRDRAITN